MIYSLLDQAKGWGNFHKIAGLYLRELGVAGLVFPSVRGDAKVEFRDNVVTTYSGWSFVNFQSAPRSNIFAFYELRPRWPSELVHEGGDDNFPTSPAFADQVAVSVEGYSSGRGHLSVRGLQSRTQASYWFDSASEAVRYRLNANSGDVEYLRLFVVSLDVEQAANFSAMILFSILGVPLARNNLREVLKIK